MLSLKYSLKCCTCLNLFEFGFENPIEKELENPEKREKRKQPSRPKSAQPGRAPAPPDRRTLPVSGSSLSCASSLSRSLSSGADLSALVSFTHSLSLSVSRVQFASAEPLPPHVPYTLSASWTCLVSSAFLAPAVDQRMRTRARRRVSQPRRPPTRPAPFIKHRQCPAHTPRLISLSFTLSRALPTPPAVAGDPHPRSWPSSSPETAPSLPELRPEVRHPSPCPISLITPCVRPISPSPVLDRGGPPCSRGGRPI
jgi:hypothetical protein